MKEWIDIDAPYVPGMIIQYNNIALIGTNNEYLNLSGLYSPKLASFLGVLDTP
jgi:hypothetical protein